MSHLQLLYKGAFNLKKRVPVFLSHITHIRHVHNTNCMWFHWRICHSLLKVVWKYLHVVSHRGKSSSVLDRVWCAFVCARVALSRNAEVLQCSLETVIWKKIYKVEQTFPFRWNYEQYCFSFFLLSRRTRMTFWWRRLSVPAMTRTWRSVSQEQVGQPWQHIDRFYPTTV